MKRARRRAALVWLLCMMIMIPMTALPQVEAGRSSLKRKLIFTNMADEPPNVGWSDRESRTRAGSSGSRLARGPQHMPEDPMAERGKASSASNFEGKRKRSEYQNLLPRSQSRKGNEISFDGAPEHIPAGSRVLISSAEIDQTSDELMQGFRDGEPPSREQQESLPGTKPDAQDTFSADSGAKWTSDSSSSGPDASKAFTATDAAQVPLEVEDSGGSSQAPVPVDSVQAPEVERGMASDSVDGEQATKIELVPDLGRVASMGSAEQVTEVFRALEASSADSRHFSADAEQTIWIQQMDSRLCISLAFCAVCVVCIIAVAMKPQADVFRGESGRTAFLRRCGLLTEEDEFDDLEAGVKKFRHEFSSMLRPMLEDPLSGYLQLQGDMGFRGANLHTISIPTDVKVFDHIV